MTMNEILNDWLAGQKWGAQRRLAAASGLSESYISEMVNGEAGGRLSTGTAKALEKGTGIKAAVWLGLEDYKPRLDRRATDRKRAGAS